MLALWWGGVVLCSLITDDMKEPPSALRHVVG